MGRHILALTILALSCAGPEGAGRAEVPDLDGSTARIGVRSASFPDIPRAIGDVNGDGADDLLMEPSGKTAEIWYGATGFPKSGTSFSAATGKWPSEHPVDLDDDGYDDLLLHTRGGTRTWSVHPGSSSGPSSTAAWTSSCEPILLGDVDDDGTNDAAWCGSSGLELRYGTSSGLPSTADLTLSGLVPLAGGDLDGDGYDDLVAQRGDYEVEVWRGGSSGLATSAWKTFSPGSSSNTTRLTWWAAVGNFDSDSDAELLVSGDYETRTVVPYTSTTTKADTGLIYDNSSGSWTSTVVTRSSSLSCTACGSSYGIQASPSDVVRDPVGTDLIVVYNDSVHESVPYRQWYELIDKNGMVHTGGPLIAVADLDGDGRDDFADQDGSPGRGPYNVRFATGARLLPVSATSGLNPFGVGDFDGDGAQDVAMVSEILTGSVHVSPDVDGDGFDSVPDGGTDCDDTDYTIYPGATEIWYDGVDQDCDGRSDYDQDDDGQDSDAYGGTDCNDLNAWVGLGFPEAWYDGVDQDCLGGSDYDQDGDGQDWDRYPGGTDCDDTDPAINTDASEAWYDGVDQDCDGRSDYDQDEDGQDSAVYGGTDCDDTDPESGLGFPEVWYDGIDQGCDKGSDFDQDGDGQDWDRFAGGTDCDDTDPKTGLGFPEVWYDGIDQGCDGGSDYDQDGDGVDSDFDCDDTDASVFPGAPDAWYDGVDSDCAGNSDFDQDGDGFDRDVDGGLDCDDLDAGVNPDATEGIGDGVDQDCDGGEICLLDADKDGYAKTGATALSSDADCDDAGELPAGAPFGDCDDGDATSYPGAPELIADGIDQDCDGGDACYTDLDEDGWRTGRSMASADLDCSDPGEADSTVPDGDCDDDEPTTYPGAPDRVGDGVDSDCDGRSSCSSVGSVGSLGWLGLLALPAVLLRRRNS